MSAGALEQGAIIGDRYRLHRRLGEGGMGFVWEASHIFTHARFALKFLKGAREEDRRRFHREVKAAAAVRHSNVIGVHDFVELPNGTLVMVMDLLEGETLGALLRREGRLALPDAAAILVQVVSALEAAHAAGIVHRDLKPDNIFLSEKEGHDIEVKVLDFGVAKLTAVDGLAARSQALTGTGSILGTPYYMAPEQIVSEKDLDGRADIWSLGIVTYECLAGVRPTEGDNVGRVLKRILLVDFEPITEHCKDLPEDVASLVANMLVGEREKRLRDLAEVRAVLERHAARRVPVFARPASAELIDAHADTVASTSERPEAMARADTQNAVSMGAAQPSRSRSRSRARVIGAAAVVVLGGAAALGFGLATKKSAPTASVTPMIATSSERPALPSAAVPTASAPSSAGAPPIAPEPNASANAPPVASAPIALQRVAPPGRRPIIAAAPAASVTQAPLATPPAPIACAAPPTTPDAPKPPLGFAKSRKD